MATLGRGFGGLNEVHDLNITGDAMTSTYRILMSEAALRTLRCSMLPSIVMLLGSLAFYFGLQVP